MHNREDSGTYRHEYGHGYQHYPQATGDPAYRTIMAYGCSGTICPTLPYFSSSQHSVTFHGSDESYPLGDASHDNARRISEALPHIAHSCYDYVTMACNEAKEVDIGSELASCLPYSQPESYSICSVPYTTRMRWYSVVGNGKESTPLIYSCNDTYTTPCHLP